MINIYYLDDEPFLCETFSMLFGSERVLISTFTDPLEAIEACNEDQPDLIFIDLMLPAMSGLEVAKKIPASIKKVLVTGDLSPPKDVNFIAVLEKPYDRQSIDEIIDKVEREISQKKS